MFENFLKLTDSKLDSGSSENLKQDKYQNICTYAYHIQTTENQKQRTKYFERSQRYQ